MNHLDLFGTTERLATHPALGRTVRVGAAANAGRSDRLLVLQRIEADDRDGALEALDHVHRTHGEMLGAAVEWALQCPETARRHLTPENAGKLTAAAYAQWQADTESLGPREGADEALAAVAPLLRPGASAAADDPAKPIFTGLVQRCEQLRQQLKNAQATEAGETLDAYFEAARIRHDALFQYPCSYATAVLQERGQAACETLIRYSLQETSFHPGLFELAKSMAPQDLAGFLAEHLRAHFSGQQRDGSVEVVEENDRYRLIFRPCGSGGAMRRRLEAGSAGPERLPEATPMTWQRAGQVPPFCAHCAYNEIRSVELLGYPLVVTEFDPDASKPCGWTIYKDPGDIPEQYWARIGKRSNRE